MCQPITTDIHAKENIISNTKNIYIYAYAEFSAFCCFLVIKKMTYLHTRNCHSVRSDLHLNDVNFKLYFFSSQQIPFKKKQKYLPMQSFQMLP